MIRISLQRKEFAVVRFDDVCFKKRCLEGASIGFYGEVVTELDYIVNGKEP